MTAVSDYLYGTDFSFWIRLFVGEMLFFTRYRRRGRFLLRFLPSVIAAFAVAYLSERYASQYLFIGFFSICPGIMFVLSVGLLWLCFELEFREVLFYAVAAYTMQNFIFNVTGALHLIVGSGMPSGYLLLSDGVLAAAVFVFFYFAFVKRIKKNERIGINNYEIIIFSVAALGVAYVLNAWVRYDAFHVSALICCAASCIFLLLIQFGMSDRGKLRTENETLRRILKEDAEQRKSIEKNIDDIRIRCHDIKHQIAAIRRDADMKAQDESLRKLEKSVTLYDSFAQTGNHALDVVLTEKGILCARNEIRLSVIADGKALSFMSEEDVYSLFGNALSNAIEHLLKVADKDKRFIDLNISQTGKLVGIHMENYLETPPEFANGLPVTAKADKNLHGYGMKSIRGIVEKYGGTMEIETADCTFALGIMFPAIN